VVGEPAVILRVVIGDVRDNGHVRPEPQETTVGLVGLSDEGQPVTVAGAVAGLGEHGPDRV